MLHQHWRLAAWINPRCLAGWGGALIPARTTEYRPVVELSVNRALRSPTMDSQEIKRLIEAGLPGAHVEVRDTTGGGDHFEAMVVSDSFEGKGLIERHQAVYAALGDAMRARIHALSLTTLTPIQYSNRR